jgi:toxin CptA
MGASLLECKYSEAELQSGEARVEMALWPSRVAAIAILAMAVATQALVAATPGPMALRFLVVAAIACAALEALYAIALRHGRRGVRTILVQGTGEIDVELATGRWSGGRVSDGCFVAPWLTIIRWRPHGARFDRSIVLLPDMMPRAEFRRLRVLLRWS